MTTKKTPQRETREPDVPESYASAVRALERLQAAMERCPHDQGPMIELSEALQGTPFPAFEKACKAAVHAITGIGLEFVSTLDGAREPAAGA